MELAAEILPLDGKYYSTLVRVWYGDDSTLNTTIEICVPEGMPSERACEHWDITQEEWCNNIDVDNGWGGMSPIKSLFPSDNHYESEISYQIATAIVNSINKKLKKRTG